MLLKSFAITWAIVMAAVIAYVFPPLALALVYYVIACVYLSSFILIPIALAGAAFLFWKRRKSLL